MANLEAIEIGQRARQLKDNPALQMVLDAMEQDGINMALRADRSDLTAINFALAQVEFARGFAPRITALIEMGRAAEEERRNQQAETMR